ncbi:MAG TPA: inorganic diphosphatase [Anaerolineae bacterium]|nr:inorganic diphosphatase [Anaerolineae bacterium]
MSATLADLIEVQIVSPGDDCAVYEFDPHGKGLRLKAIHRTSKPAPFDLAEVPESSLENTDNVPVWLLTHPSVFPGTFVTARPIGLLRSKDEASELRWVIAVPQADPQTETIRAIGDLPEEKRQALSRYARNGSDEEDILLHWEPAAEALNWIHQSKQETRIARARQEKAGTAQPAWKPLGYLVSGARRAHETEPNSDAEYAYHQLPARFQKYVDEYLASDERILFAVNRPTMKSALRKSFFSRATRHEGILFVTDQQLSLVTEILPPGVSNIRYGYIADTSPLERIEAIAAEALDDQVAVLSVKWQAASGSQLVRWEFPRKALDELREVARIAANWQPRPNDRRLRRAAPIELPEIPLRDPAANDPNETVPVAQRLTDAIAREVSGEEKVLARALLPGRFDRRGCAEVIVVTTCRLLRIPDPAMSTGAPRAIEVRHIASLEFCESILESYLAAHYVEQGRVHTERIAYPFTGVGFRDCFLALRRQMVVRF